MQSKDQQKSPEKPKEVERTDVEVTQQPSDSAHVVPPEKKTKMSIDEARTTLEYLEKELEKERQEMIDKPGTSTSTYKPTIDIDKAKKTLAQLESWHSR